MGYPLEIQRDAGLVTSDRALRIVSIRAWPINRPLTVAC